MRLLAACPTLAGGERCFKRVSAVMSKNRSTVSVAKATKQAQIFYNGGQHERSDAIDSFVRSKQENHMRRDMAVGIPQPGAGGVHLGHDLDVFFWTPRKLEKTIRCFPTWKQGKKRPSLTLSLLLFFWIQIISCEAGAGICFFPSNMYATLSKNCAWMKARRRGGEGRSAATV